MGTETKQTAERAANQEERKSLMGKQEIQAIADKWNT